MDIIDKIEILYGVNVDDHMPLRFHLKTSILLSPIHNVRPIDDRHYVAWNKVSDQDVSNYQNTLTFLLSDLDLDSMLCLLYK